jgi:hypothetical protein
MEDQRRILQEWKDKADIDGHHLGRFVISDLYEWRKNVNQFVEVDPDFTDYRGYRVENRDEVRAKINMLLVKLLRKYEFNTENT